MTDLDLLTGTVAARIRLLPEVARLYPGRTGLAAVTRSVGGLLDAVADDPNVVVRPVDGEGALIEVSVGVSSGVGAPDAGRAIAAAVRDACLAAGVDVGRVRVRVASID